MNILQTPLYVIKETDLVFDSSISGLYRIKDLPQEEKPREKLLKYGPSTLSTRELIAVLLGVGTKKEDVLAMSSRLLKEYGERSILNQKDPKRLSAALDIPLIKACQIVASLELGKRFYKPLGNGPVFLRTPEQVYEYLKDMRELPKEYLRGLYLNAHYQLMHDEVISMGTITSNIIHPREVFRPALEYGCSALILAHNHPSGVVSPSETDVAITKQLIDAGKLLGITLLDHLIITRSKFSSISAEYDV